MTKLKKGDVVRSEDGKREFIVDALIHTGTGQGDVYKVHSDKDIFALKLFHTGDMNILKRQMHRLQLREERAPPLFTLCTLST